MWEIRNKRTSVAANIKIKFSAGVYMMYEKVFVSCLQEMLQSRFLYFKFHSEVVVSVFGSRILMFQTLWKSVAAKIKHLITICVCMMYEKQN